MSECINRGGNGHLRGTCIAGGRIDHLQRVIRFALVLLGLFFVVRPAFASGTVPPQDSTYYTATCNPCDGAYPGSSVHYSTALEASQAAANEYLSQNGTTQVSLALSGAGTFGSPGQWSLVYVFGTGTRTALGSFVKTTLAAVCPANSTGNGTTPPTSCVCNTGYRPNASADACAPLYLIPRASNPPPQACPNLADQGAGNPIYPLRGVKRETVDTGVQLGGLSLVFTYDSTLLVPKTPTSLIEGSSGTQAMNPGVLGLMWSGNLFKRISLVSVSSGATTNPAAAAVPRGDGRVVSLSSDTSTGQFTAEANTSDRLVALSGGGLRYYDSTARTAETYDASTQGNLSGISWADGRSVSLTYSTASTPTTIAPGSGYLIQAVDNTGRVVNFTYLARTAPLVGAQLNTIIDAAGHVITFGYDVSGNIGSITWPHGQVRSFTYQNNSGLYGALTGITDELGVTYANFGYDADWRAVSTQHAGGVDSFSTSYTTPPSILITEVYDGAAGVVYHYHDWTLPQGTVMTDPLGSMSAWTATSLLNKNYLSGKSQPAGSGCAASTSAQTYDANGNVSSKDDFNGTRVCYANDLTRNLETARVEGLANTATCSTYTAANATLPTGNRKVSSQWHADWRLEAKVAEPGRLTTSIYNGQPDPFNANAVASCAPSTALLPDGKPIAVLCKQVQQATTDVDGHLGFTAALQSGVANRVQQWTYNQYGQVLTAKDPLNNTTSYAYYADTAFTGTDPNAVGHTLGDLQTMTNAKSQVTTYTQYDKHGNLLQMSDPNGVVTTNTYDLRQRLLSTSVGGQTTSYSYDPAGQLLKVTAPDASWIGYEYDPAHRMTATKDNLGNRIEYTLDNAGNRVAENVKDTSGALRRQLARSIDALGRTQQTTGRE